MKRKANEIDSSTSKKARTAEKTPKNAFEKLVIEMTDTMTRVTLTNTTTTNTTTISSSASSSSSSHLVNDLTLVQSSSSTSISSALPLQSISTTIKDKKSKPRKIHTYDDYLVYILKWPVSLIDELGLNTFILIIIK